MTTPPPLPTNPASQTRGKPFATTALVIAVIGALPLLIYFYNCIDRGNPLLIIAMGFIGFVIHAAGLICGIIGVSMGSKNLALASIIGNGIILGAVLLFGFVAIASF